jgi:ATP-dependent DNA helicase PIF1
VNELGGVEPYSFLSRTQIALVAGWAMTVLKSQGMALNRVVVNLSKSFEEGQLYVALSWAQSLQGLNAEGLGYQLRRNEQVRQLLYEKFGIR